MVSRRHRAGAGMLAVTALGMLVPMRQSQARSEDVGKPSPFQVVDYNNGNNAWDDAVRGNPQARPAHLDKAERLFEKAAAGRSRFPEALLALGLVRFTRNNLRGAETAFREVAALQKGYLRAEALTYLGLVHLYNHHWSDAQNAFQSAMDEKSEEYTAWMGPKGREKLSQTYHDRRMGLDALDRMGIAIAGFQAAKAKAGPGSDPRKLLADTEKLLPPDELARCATYFNGVDAALWNFTPPAGEWRYSLRDGLPPDVRPVTPSDLIRSLRIWAAAELAIEPPANLPPVAELSDTDRQNLAAGQVKRALKLEAAGNTAAALAAWEQVAKLPGYELPARQHRIYLLLRPAAGGKAPSAASIDQARQLIRGPLADKDPLVYDQQMALVSAILAGAPASGTARRPVVALARTECRLVLNGIPGAGKAPTSGPVRDRAEMTVGLLAAEAENPGDLNHWRTALTECPARPGRERLRYYLTQQLALAAVNGRQPEQAAAALNQANIIATGGEGNGTTALPGATAEVAKLRRYMVARVFELKDADRYRTTLLKDSDYIGEYLAYLASEEAKALDAALKANPTPGPEAQARWQAIGKKLEEARAHSGANSALTAKLDADLAEIKAYSTAVDSFPPTIAVAWTEAAGKTNQAAKPADWDVAATSWRGVLAMMVGRPATERREVALHVVHSHLRKADVLYAEGKKDAARTALRQARAELITMPEAVGSHLTQEDKERIEQRVSNNGKALNAGTYLAGTKGEKNIPGFRGSTLKPVATECVIIRYKSPHTPNVDQWLQDLRTHPSAVRRLVDWFNNGPVAQKTPGAKRDFSANPSSPNYLVTFLEKHAYRKPGALPVGTVQWCDHNGKGPWHGSVIKKAGGAAYYLKDGTPIIRTVCSNPIGVIRTYTVTAEWIPQEESASPRAVPGYPSIAYGKPVTPVAPGGWTERPQVYVLTAATAPKVNTVAPTATLVATTHVLPQLALPRCQVPEPVKRASR